MLFGSPGMSELGDHVMRPHENECYAPLAHSPLDWDIFVIHTYNPVQQ
jgi:hypothetical protein